jgi:hypothetical protein
MEKLYPSVSACAEYAELIAVLREPAHWNEAHAMFGRIRVKITLPQEAMKKKGLDSLFAYVAENAAKTAYNCSCTPVPEPFDDDSFEWLLKCEAQFHEAHAAISARPDTTRNPMLAALRSFLR